MRRLGCSESHWSKFVSARGVAEWVRALYWRPGGPAGDAATYFASEL